MSDVVVVATNSVENENLYHHNHHGNVYEEVSLSDMTYNIEEQMYQYQCPCGDLFEITLEELWDGEDVALCPSCTLKVRVLYEESDLPELDEDAFVSENSEDEDGHEIVPENLKTTAAEKNSEIEDSSSDVTTAVS